MTRSITMNDLSTIATPRTTLEAATTTMATTTSRHLDEDSKTEAAALWLDSKAAASLVAEFRQLCLSPKDNFRFQEDGGGVETGVVFEGSPTSSPRLRSDSLSSLKKQQQIPD